MMKSHGVERVEGEKNMSRQTFRDEVLELFVWRHREALAGFELHYDVASGGAWSMRWTKEEGTTYHDLAPDGQTMAETLDPLPLQDLRAEFLIRSVFVDERARNMVL